MDDEKLILLVRSNEHLYNKSKIHYKSVEAKKKTWEKIGEVMGETDDDCMRKWTSLRDRYVREKRNAADNPKTEDGTYRFRWPYMDIMSFIDPHVLPRPKRKRNPNLTPDISLPLIVEIEQPPNQNYFKTQPYSPLPSPIERCPLSDPEQSEVEQTHEPEQTYQPEQEPEIIFRKKRKFNTEEASDTDKLFSDAVEAFKHVCRTREEKVRQVEEAKKEENEPLYSFGKMIIATIASLNPMKQAKAMQQCTDIVMRLKMETESELHQIIGEIYTN